MQNGSEFWCRLLVIGFVVGFVLGYSVAVYMVVTLGR